MLNQLVLMLISTAAAQSLSCSSDNVKYHQTTGVDCVQSDFVRIVSGLCTTLDCGIYCAASEKCKSFRLLTSGTCQCKLFLFDACSHRVQSEPNCTNQVTVYVRALPGVPPGRLCPPGYQHTRYGTSYKVVTGPTASWSSANQTCNSSPGLSKFADGIDLAEAEYLRSLKQMATGSSYNYHVGGYAKSGMSATSYSSWFWAACDLPINSTVWYSGEPNGGSQTGCTNLYSAFSTGGIDDHSCSVSQPYICECQSVF